MRLGHNQGDFGALAGVSKTTQLNYEKGLRSPDTDYLCAIAGIGVDVPYVLTGIATPRPSESLQIEEAALLDDFKRLTPADKTAVLRLTAALAETTQATAEKNK